MRLRHFFALTAIIAALMGTGCNMDYRSKDDGGSGNASTEDIASKLTAIQYLRSSDIDIRAELITDKDNDNVLAVSHQTQEYMYYKFTKRGSTSSEEADSSGTNAAVLASDSAVLTVRDSLILSSGDHAHGLFALGEGTSAIISDCVVSVFGANSSGIITSQSGTADLHHVTAETFGASSPVLRVREGGGAIVAERGKFSAYGADSPAIFSEGEISLLDAKIEAGKANAIIIEGKSSVVMTSCDVVAESDSLPAVMMFMDKSANAVSNAGAFSMTYGKISCNGDMFYVSNAAANITLNDVELEPAGALIRSQASSWGTSGVNGGKITLTAVNQAIDGDIYLDGLSDMNMYLTDGSYFTGTINPSGTGARVFVDISGSKWVLTGDSHIDSLTCEENSITLNGNSLYVAGNLYTASTASTGQAVDFDSDRTTQPSTQDEGSSGENTSSEDTSNDDTGNDDTSGEDENSGDEDTNTGDEDTTTPEIEVARLSFDSQNPTTGTASGIAYRAYNDIVYVSNPVTSDCQKLSVYIPEPYFSGLQVNGYTAQTAPIFIPNNSSGYMAASIITPADNNVIGLALAHGLVVVSPALRGRNVNDGTAPASIVDYKAAVRYIRANKGSLPAGNTDRIIACGVSSGGALSALLGASGNSSDYDMWLEELGAAEAGDEIFAAVSYCPVTDLENADGAYEWVFGGAKYGEDSVSLSESFESYVNSLSLTNGSEDLEIYEDDEDYTEGFSFRRYIEGLYVKVAQSALDSGVKVSADWLNVSGDTVMSADLEKYADSFTVRQKGIPAFDKFDLSSPENSMFGYKHFTDYSLEHSTVGGELADTEIIWVMNPMNYIGYDGTCRHWRIRHGVNDRDIAITTSAVLALSLENEEYSVDFAAAWEQGHGGYYDTEELFGWIDSICK